jgi:membrane-bound serine protease (ClpP class)
MGFLINPNAAYILIVVAVLLFMLTINNPKSKLAVAGMALCLAAAGYELIHLRANPWVLLIVGLSPLPFIATIRQARLHLPLLIVTILMLTVAPVFLFVDQNGYPAVSYVLAGLVAAICGDIIWITIGQKQNAQGRRLDDDPDSVVGLLGKARTAIENHTAGSVEVEGELWTARSKVPIAAGSMVRILRRDGFVLTVKKEERVARE